MGKGKTMIDGNHERYKINRALTKLKIWRGLNRDERGNKKEGRQAEKKKKP